MPRASLTTALALLALPAAAQPGSPVRAFEPVVLEGRRLPTLLGADVAEVVGYRLSGGIWAPIPVQVDERDVLDIGLAYRGGDFHPPGGCNTECQQLFGTVHMVYWTDPDTWIGPDANPTFDADDELAFMARDGGDRRDALTPDPPDVAAGSRVEVRLTAPEGGAPTYVYLFESVGAPASPAPYVRYNRVFCHKDMQTPSDDCDPIPDTVPFTEHYDVYGHGDGETFTYVGYLLGANPEDTWFDGDTYRLHFSDRWILDSLALGPDRPDLIDRMKVNPPNVCGRHERTASHGRGAFIVNRSGPVRAIRAVIGFNSAPMTQRDYVMYDRYFEERTFFRGHPIAADRGKILYFDYSPAALGMRYTSNLDADGFVIDGHPDTPSPGVLTWEAVRGEGSSEAGTILSRFDSDFKPVVCDGPCVTIATTGTFVDSGENAPGSAVRQCTGDTVSLGASGFRYLPEIPNTDPRPALVQQHHELYNLELTRRTVLDPASLSDAALATLRDRLDAPLLVTVDPGGFAEAGPARAQADAATQLLPPRPNPADGRFVVPFTLAAPAPVRLVLLDVLGREVQVLDEGALPAGPHEVAVDAATLSAGTYLVRLTTPDGEQTQRVTVAGTNGP